MFRVDVATPRRAASRRRDDCRQDKSSRSRRIRETRFACVHTGDHTLRLAWIPAPLVDGVQAAIDVAATDPIAWLVGPHRWMALAGGKVNLPTGVRTGAVATAGFLARIR